MPIQLVTGAPGHGKTQYAIDHLLRRAEDENRPVFYTNIEGIMMADWREFDPLAIETTEKNVHRYEGVPDGALLLLDEASYIFKQRRGTEEAPPEEKILTTHRHAGYDIVIVTQHPTDIPAYSRRRVEDHFHLKRKRKKNVSLVYQWSEGEIGEVKDGAVQNAYRAVKSLYRFRPEIWGKYKSTTINTVKAARWPWKVYVLPVMVLAFGYFLYQAYQLAAGGLSGSGELDQTVEQGPLGFPGSGGSGDGEAFKTEDERRRERANQGLDFVEARLQTVPGVPMSEPRYAGLVSEPKSYPRLQCVLYGHDELPENKAERVEANRFPVGGTCLCYTQQATRAEVTDRVCRDIVYRGLFDPQLEDTALKEDEGSGRDGAAAPAPRLIGVGDVGESRERRGGSVTVVPDNSERPQLPMDWVEERERELREGRN